MNNTELVRFAESKIGTAYVYGMKGTVMTEKQYTDLKRAYGDNVWDSDRNKVGQVCVDCSGLISWATGIIRNSDGYHDTAVEVHPISTISKAPVGAAVWKDKHIGIYTGNGTYIAADGSAYGVRRNSLSKASFTHWLILKDITYITEQGDDEVTEKSKIIVEGQELPVERILKDGSNYIKATDFSDAMGLEIGHKGNVATFDTQTSKIMVDGKEIQAKRVLIGGRNYVRLNDVADAIGYDLSNKGNMAILEKK
jgi:hypothetical protein